MRVFVDWPWSHDVRQYGTPMRAYIHFKRGMLMVGLWPTIKGQKREADGSYGDTYRWITWHPDSHPRKPWFAKGPS